MLKGLKMGMPEDRVILLQNVTVKYRAPEERIGTFKEYMIRALQRKVRYKEFLALDQINMDIQKGETLLD